MLTVLTSFWLYSENGTPSSAASLQAALLKKSYGSDVRLSVAALAELGYAVLEAQGASDALALLDAHPDIVLLFTDVVMPGVDGPKLAREALKRRPDLKVLFTSGYAKTARPLRAS